jgi:hypothetical protein
MHWALVHIEQSGLATMSQRIGINPPHRWQLDVPGSVQTSVIHNPVKCGFPGQTM